MQLCMLPSIVCTSDYVVECARLRILYYEMTWESKLYSFHMCGVALPPEGRQFRLLCPVAPGLNLLFWEYTSRVMISCLDNLCLLPFFANLQGVRAYGMNKILMDNPSEPWDTGRPPRVSRLTCQETLASSTSFFSS